MKLQILVAGFLLLAVMCFGQSKPKQARLKAGDKITESLGCIADNGNPSKYDIPNGAYTLLYRFGNINGIKDNYDSLCAIIPHVYRLNKYFGPKRKPSRLTCYIYVKEVNDAARTLKSSIKRWNKAICDSMISLNPVGYNFMRVWEILFVPDTTVTRPGSLLSANKLSMIGPDGAVLATSPIKTFRFGEKKGTIKGKMLTEKKGKKVPLPNVLVSLTKTGTENPDSVLTDEFGDFELPVQDEKANYNITVKVHPGEKEVTNIILATQSGQEISRMKSNGNHFEYKLIQVDMVLLQELEEEDILLKLSKFKASRDSKLNVTENILYDQGKYTFDDDSKEILDKVLKILKEDPNIRLQVISHTDAVGDDNSNILLSEKRSASVVDYFVTHGIDKSRLSSIGKGEKEIRNRCANGVNCSDKEHEFNRRTEFKFSKS